VEGDARILGSALVTDDAYVGGDAVLDGNDRAIGRARVVATESGGWVGSNVSTGRRVAAVVAILVTAAAGATTGYAAATTGGPPTARSTTALGPIPETGFGGYIWRGNATVVRGDWQVPTIMSTSLPGWASTWIAVQGPGKGGAFVQLGTIENCQLLPGAINPGPDGSQPPCQPYYEAFWSDSQHGFEPVSLGMVAPGGRVSAEIARTQSGWRLVMSGGHSAELVVPFGSSSLVNEGEWIQEDPPLNLQISNDLPYPTTSTVTFDHLEINGHYPRLVQAESQALSSPSGIDLVPTPVHDDSFSLVPASGAAAQFLADVTPYDDAATAYDQALGQWNAESVATRLAELQRFDVALGTFDSALEGQTWPEVARSALATLVSRNDRAQAYLAGRMNPALLGRDQVPAIPKDDSGVSAARQLRAALGLPPL
jgi:hypothetical protein